MSQAMTKEELELTIRELLSLYWTHNAPGEIDGTISSRAWIEEDGVTLSIDSDVDLEELDK